MYKVLSIAGSDCSGGAGIQADLKTMSAHKIYGMSVITALTAQNTMGVTGVLDSTPEFVEQQMDAIFTDIIPDAIKIGMVSNKDIIVKIAEKLAKYNGVNIVLDPVMISTSGSKLLSDDAIEVLKTQLIPLATIITPNILEAECLSGLSIESKKDMEKAALKIQEIYPGYILIKGGHLLDSSDDLLCIKNNFYWYPQVNIENENTHGTGCTLSSAIACNLAIGHDVKTSVQHAKTYITGALKANMNIGKGKGPLNHFWA